MAGFLICTAVLCVDSEKATPAEKLPGAAHAQPESLLDQIANSRIITAINAAGNAVDRATRMINPAAMLKDGIDSAQTFFQEGRYAAGVAASVVAATSVIPVDAAIVDAGQAIRYLPGALRGRGFFGRRENVESMVAKNHISGLRLQRELSIKEASSIFNDAGYLTDEVIANSRIIIRGDKLGNEKLISDLISKGGNISEWGKYRTPLVNSCLNMPPVSSLMRMWLKTCARGMLLCTQIMAAL